MTILQMALILFIFHRALHDFPAPFACSVRFRFGLR
jgi:hypothetical protein